MPFVDAKCKNCGANLKVDADLNKAFCSFCGTEYIVEQAIEYYRISNSIYAQNVNISAKGEAEKERLLYNAKINADIYEYKKATDVYETVIEDYPDDYRGWYGLANMLSRQFTKADCEPEEFNKLKTYISRAIRFAPPDKKAEIKARWDKYSSEHDMFLSVKRQEAQIILNNALSIQECKEKKEEELNTENKKRDNCYERMRRIHVSKKDSWLFWFVVGCFLTIFDATMMGVHEEVSGYVFFLLIGIIIILLSLITPIKRSKLRKRTEEYEAQCRRCSEISREIYTLNSNITELKEKAEIIYGRYRL